MTTYKQIQNYIKQVYGYVPKSCWIAHMKEEVGLNPKTAFNRESVNHRKHPCPSKKQKDLIDAFEHFDMI